MLLLSTQRDQIYFCDFAQFEDFANFDVAQAKENSYCDHHQVDQLFLLAIKVFGCLHK
jgi:hypothetical protein